jgi:hypothetical protein
MVTIDDAKKYLESLESVAEEMEQILYTLLEKYGLDPSDAIDVLQLLSAKMLLKENEKAGGDLLEGITKDFIFKMKLFMINKMPNTIDVKKIMDREISMGMDKDMDKDLDAN